MSETASENQKLCELKAQLSVYKEIAKSNESFQESKVDEIDLNKWIDALLNEKWKIILTTVFFLCISLSYALLTPNIYKSEAIVISNSNEPSSNGLSALAGQFGGLASLAGINLGSNSNDKTSYILQVMQSRNFLFSFINENRLKVEIMAAEGWDRDSNQITFDENIYEKAAHKWVRDKGPRYPKEPTILETYDKFKEEMLSVKQDKETGMIKIALSHYSPYWAKQTLDKLILAINLEIKNQDMIEATKSIEYLQNEVKELKVVDSQAMFFQLIEQQYQTLVLTKVREDYAFKVVDAPIVPEEKVKPQRILIIILGTIMGLLISIVLVTLMQIKKNR